jgi:hypothetical protein
MAWAPVFTDGKPLFIERDGILAPAWSEEPCDTDCCGEDPPPPLTCTPCLNVTIAGLPLWTSNDGLFVVDYRPLNGGYQLALAGGQGSTCCTWGTTVNIPIPGSGGSIASISATCCNGEAFVFFQGSGGAPILLLSADPADTVGTCPTGFSHPLNNGYQLVGPPVGGTATGTPANCTSPPICIPPTVAFVNTPPANTTSTTATFTWTTTGTVGATLLKLDGGTAVSPTSSGVHNYHSLTPGPHTVEIEVLSLGGCGNASASYTWTVEGEPPVCIPPTVGFTSVPPLSTQNTTATFNWSTTGTVALTAIRLDDLPFTNPSGSNTHTYSNLSVGTHTVTVQVQAPCGIASDSFTWTVTSEPCVPPTITLTQTPPASTTSTDANFTWTTTGTVATTLIRIDGGAFTTPSGSSAHSYSNLSPGNHSVEVQAQSGSCGNASALYTWTITVPCVPPTVTLTQTPPVQTTNTTAVFAWTTTGTVALQFVRIDGGPLLNPSGSNTHTFNNLAPGTHQVEVQVQSGACGNASAFHIWEISAPCVPPQVTFTQTPSNPTTSTSAAFAWNSTGSITQTTIRIDGGAPQTPNGTNAHTFSNLATGSHTVEVFVGGPCGTDTDTYTWQITPATTLCEKVNSLFQLIGTAEPNVDVEITFSGVFANNCGLTNYNRTYLIPGPHVPINNCPDVTVCETIIDTVGCGVISGTYPDGSWILCPNLNLAQINGLPTLAWLLCTGCTSPGISTPPMIRVRSSVPATGTSGDQFADFAASGTAQVTALVDQMLATGSCQIPFFSQIPANPGPTTGFPNRDFRFATCTIRIL